jgi:hypothetical protein
MKYFFILLIDAALLGLYLYSKLSPIKDRLDAKHRGWYNTADGIFGWAARGLAKTFKPYKLGDGVYMDMGQFMTFCILLLFTLIAVVWK